MTKDQKIILFMVSVPLVAILTIFMISKINFGLALSPSEMKLYTFRYENIPKIAERSPARVSSLKSPIVLSRSSKGFPETPLAELSPPPSMEEKRVSMILVNRNKKIAIIDGKLVKEGDVIDQNRIARIEKDKVLLKNKEGEKWLKLE